MTPFLDQSGTPLIGTPLTRALVRVPDSPRRKRHKVLWFLFWVAVGIVAVAVACTMVIALNVTGGL